MKTGQVPATIPDSTSAIVATILTPDEITALLQQRGAIDPESSTFNRMKVDGSMFLAGDEVFPYNPVRGDPAFIARIVAPPGQYQGFWFTDVAAKHANRPEIANRMCKSYYDVPSQARKYSETGASCDACPFNPFRPPPLENMGKCQWRGDLDLQIVPADGELTGEETIWTLTLSMTGMIEWRGTRKTPSSGSVSEFNFMYKLANLAQEKAAEWGVSPTEAVNIALTSYNLGGVAAEFRLLRASNEDKSRTWSVVSATPIHIQPITEDTTESDLALDLGPETFDGEVAGFYIEPRLHIAIAYDGDEPGQNATTKAYEMIDLLLGHWGHPRDPSNDDDRLIAFYQRHYDTIDPENEEALSELWDHIVHLQHTRKENAYPEATSADEYCAASEAEEAMKMMVPERKGINFKAIKERVDIVEHISQYTRLRRSGVKYVGKCPFPGHDDSSASFWVYPDTKSCWCFGCQRGGDVIDFVKHHSGARADTL